MARTRAITPIRPGADLLRALPAGATVSEQQPPWRFFMDLFRRQPFVFAVIPLHQITIDFGALAETCQIARLAGALKRARQDQCEVELGQDRRPLHRELLLPLSVSGMSVSPVCCPLTLHSVSAMPHEKDFAGLASRSPHDAC